MLERSIKNYKKLFSDIFDPTILIPNFHWFYNIWWNVLVAREDDFSLAQMFRVYLILKVWSLWCFIMCCVIDKAMYLFNAEGKLYSQ